MPTVLLALLVVVLTTAPFLVAAVLSVRAHDHASFEDEIAKLVRPPGQSH